MESDSIEYPETLIETIRYFSDPDRCVAFMVSIRWADGVVCPHCGSRAHYYLTTRRIWKCKGCKKQFSAKVGTVMEESPLGLDVWFTAMWLLANAKNGISSHELHRALGITQKSAWFVLHRIRLALSAGSFEKKLVGVVEADETYIGGRISNMHKDKKEKMPKGRGTVGKAIVMGILERGTEGKLSSVRAKVIQDIRRETLHGEVRENVNEGSSIFTDSLASYQGLEAEYVHQFVDHAVQYVDGIVHTNGLENFWSLLKRTVRGTYTHIDPDHLFRYLDEQAYRFNNRKDDDQGRFVQAVGSVSGKRLTYKELIGKKGKKDEKGAAKGEQAKE
jgi:transposase-like protein